MKSAFRYARLRNRPLFAFILIGSLFFTMRSAAQSGLSSLPLRIPSTEREELSREQRARIQLAIQTNRTQLGLQERSASERGTIVSLVWPVRLRATINDPSGWYIGRFVDHSASGIEDYNCGTRTQDGHRGTDIVAWPFPWLKTDNNELEVVAAAAGTIILKEDGNFDRECNNTIEKPWNAVYILHNDGSVAWYGHLKQNSLTAKAVGTTVSQGEYLGVVGSSGTSLSPQLHFELYDANNALVDPFAGPCNRLNGQQSWWQNQPPYRDPSIVKILTSSTRPVLDACTDQVNPKNNFQPGEGIYFLAYIRDQMSGGTVTFSIRRPDGSDFVTLSGVTSETPLIQWLLFENLPADAPTGTWTFNFSYHNQTVTHLFTVGNVTCTAPASASVTAITTSSATVNWMAVGGVTGYQVWYRPTGQANWQTITVEGAQSSLALSNLQAGVTYEVRVYSNCSTGLSTTFATTTFATTNNAPREDQYLSGDFNPTAGVRNSHIAVRRNNDILMDTDYAGGHEIGFPFGIGNGEDQYLVGDWDGDGRDNVAVRRGGLIIMDTNNDANADRL